MTGYQRIPTARRISEGGKTAIALLAEIAIIYVAVAIVLYFWVIA